MKHKKIFGVATLPRVILVKNYNGEDVYFALPFEVKVGKCVMISLDELEDEFIEPEEEKESGHEPAP